MFQTTNQMSCFSRDATTALDLGDVGGLWGDVNGGVFLERARL